MEKVFNFFGKRGLHPFPLAATIRHYSFRKVIADLRAGLNVALLDFPQGMAYALIAGLPVQMGIFCSALSSITGPFFASSRFIMLGPTNATAVMLLSTFLTLGYAPEQAVIVLPMMLLLVGIFMFAGAFIGVAAILGNYGIEAEMLSPISLRSWSFGLPGLRFGDLAVIANGALAVAFLSLLESSSIAKTLAAQSGDRIDLNQQMLSMGAANLSCAFGGGMVVSGSLTRSVLNFKSGAQTAISSIFSGLFLVAGMWWHILRSA